MTIVPLYASCLGLVSAVGLTPASACAAMRAGISRVSETAFKHNNTDPVVGAMIPAIGPRVRGRQRIIELLCLALSALPRRLPGGLDLSALPLFLCTREAERPGCNVDAVLNDVDARIDCRMQHANVRSIASGAVATFLAMDQARRLLTGGATTACLIVAVDSLLDPRSLRWLDEQQRLKKEDQPDGVIPGEAAGVLLVSKRPLSPSSVRVSGLGFGHETATVLDDEPLLGKGLAEAVRGALAEAGQAMHEIAFRLSDVAGESYSFEELVLAQIRTTTVPRPSQPLLHPASSVGDCGAANGILQLAWIEQAMNRGYAPGLAALAHASAPAGPRAAAVLTRI